MQARRRDQSRHQTDQVTTTIARITQSCGRCGKDIADECIDVVDGYTLHGRDRRRERRSHNAIECAIVEDNGAVGKLHQTGEGQHAIVWLGDDIRYFLHIGKHGIGLD